jgi:hypothetical protein
MGAILYQKVHHCNYFGPMPREFCKLRRIIVNAGEESGLPRSLPLHFSCASGDAALAQLLDQALQG